MDTIAWLLVVSVCSVVRGEPYSAASYRQRESAGNVGRYEPLMFAAVPLHAPVPVVRVLSPSPLAGHRPRPYADTEYDDGYETPRPRRARPPTQSQEAEESADYVRRPQHYDYAEYPRRPQQYEFEEYAPQRQVYAVSDAHYDAVFGSAESAPTILYAKPSPSGGYTYRRVPTRAPAPAPAPALLPAASSTATAKTPAKNPPVIIKIHKHRIVKD